MRKNREIARLGNNLRVRGKRALTQGSMAAAGARSGAAPGVGADPSAAATGPDKPKFNPMSVLKGLETGKLLDGKQMNQAARALTALELRPQLRGYKQLAAQLKRSRNEEVTGLGRLGSELQGNVGNVYGGIAGADAQGVAAQQAIAAMLNQQSGTIAAESAANLGKMQGGEVGGLTDALALRGAPVGGSAQQALSDAVAQQQTAQTNNAAAARQFAASQGAGAANLGAQMAAATQMQGGGAVAGIGRDIVGRVGETNSKYRPAIQEAVGKWADVKATKGATFSKNLLGLRGEEQKFMLGKQAVAGEKAKLGLEGEQLTEEQRHNEAEEKTNAEKAAASMKSAEASARNAAIAAYEAHNPNATNSEKRERKQEIKQEAKEVKSLIPSVLSAFGGKPPKNQSQLNMVIAKMNSSASADPAMVQRVMQKWWADLQRKADAKAHGWVD